jgi:hypothetical protein
MYIARLHAPKQVFAWWEMCRKMGSGSGDMGRGQKEAGGQQRQLGMDELTSITKGVAITHTAVIVFREKMNIAYINRLAGRCLCSASSTSAVTASCRCSRCLHSRSRDDRPLCLVGWHPSVSFFCLPPGLVFLLAKTCIKTKTPHPVSFFLSAPRRGLGFFCVPPRRGRVF